MSNKIFVIAIDGGTFTTLKPWSDKGYLPCLKKLFEEGVHGELETVFPPVTPVAWVSFMTGKNPGKHGIFDFFYRDKKSWERKANNFSCIEGKSLWKILSENGEKVCVINVPMLYPVEKVSGYLISGLMTPEGAKDYTYPPSLRDELEKEIGEYYIHYREIRRKDNIKAFINELYKILRNRIEATLYLMKKKNWDFFIVHFLGLDRLQHEMWHLLDENHPLYNKKIADKYKRHILNFLKNLDEGLAQIISKLNKDHTNVIIMSDHGFGSTYKFVNFNSWLLQKGYIKLKKNPMTRLRYVLWRCGYCPSVMYRLLEYTPMAKLRNILAPDKRTNLANRFFLSFDDVDWKRSKAYSIGNFGEIYLNLKGREPQGTVNPGREEKKIRESIIRELKEVKDPYAHKPLIKRFYRKEELYSGKYTESAADIIFELENKKLRPNNRVDFSSPKFIENSFIHPGDHRPDGILIANGPDFKKASQIKGSKIIDLAPTILYLMNIPIPKDMDGKVLTGVIRKEYLSENPIKYQKEIVEDKNKKRKFFNEEENIQIRRQLKDLGYLG